LAGSNSHKVNNDFCFPQELEELQLQELLNLIFLFGVADFGLTWTTGQNLASEGTETQLFDALWKAADVLQAWPENFRQLLRSRVRLDAAPTSLFNRLGPAYETLFKYTRNNSFDFIWKQLELFAQSQWVGHFTRKHTRIGLATATHIPLSQAARHLGLSESVVGKLLENGELAGSTEEVGGRRYRVIKLESISAYHEKVHDQIGLTDAAHTLGLKKNSILQLARDGVIHCYNSPQNDGFAYWRFSRADVEKVLSAFSDASKRPPATYFQAISFQTVCGIAGRYNKNLSDIIRAVCSGDIGPRLEDRTAKGIQAYSFSQEDVFNWIQSFIASNFPEHLDVNSTALALGTKRQAVYEWIARGFIDTKTEQPQIYISRRAIENFHQNYIVPARIAPVFDTSPTLLLKILNDRDIQPCSGPGIDGARQYLMRRHEFESVQTHEIRNALEHHKTNRTRRGPK
jgi:hypothetical protein